MKINNEKLSENTFHDWICNRHHLPFSCNVSILICDIFFDIIHSTEHVLKHSKKYNYFCLFRNMYKRIFLIIYLFNSSSCHLNQWGGPNFVLVCTHSATEDPCFRSFCSHESYLFHD